MTERLTLAQAQDAVVAACRNASVPVPSLNWDAPREQARLLWISIGECSGATIALRTAQRQLAKTLDAYAAHLDHEAGKAFSDAAVLRHIDAARATAEKGGGVISACALRDVHREIAAGLHYAEPKEP